MFSKQQIINQVIESLPVDQRTRSDHIERSYGLAVIDLANKFIEQDRMIMKTTTVAANARTVILRGINTDVAHIYYIRYGTGEEQDLLTYIPFSEFVKDYSDPSEDAGVPTKYTFLGMDPATQLPEVKFNCPAEEATTMEVYYFKDIDPNLLRDSQAPALVNVTLAFFFGIGTDVGAGFYRAYRINISDVRATGKKVVDKESKFVQNPIDENISVIRSNIRSNRA